MSHTNGNTMDDETMAAAAASSSTSASVCASRNGGRSSDRIDLHMTIVRNMVAEESSRLCTDALFNAHPNYSITLRENLLMAGIRMTYRMKCTHVYPSFVQILDRYLTATSNVEKDRIPTVAAACFLIACLVYNEHSVSTRQITEEMNDVEWLDINSKTRVVVDGLVSTADTIAQTLGYRFMDPCYTHYESYFSNIFDSQAFDHYLWIFFLGSLSPTFSCLPPSLQFASVRYLVDFEDTLKDEFDRIYALIGKSQEQVLAASCMVVESMRQHGKKQFIAQVFKIDLQEYEDLVKGARPDINAASLSTLIFGLSHVEEPLRSMTRAEFDQRYTEQVFIGKGSYGQVFSVQDQVMKTKLAVKMIELRQGDPRSHIRRLHDMISEISGFQYLTGQDGVMKTYECATISDVGAFAICSKLYDGDLWTVFNKRLWGDAWPDNTKKMLSMEEMLATRERFERDPSLMIFLKTLLRPVCRALNAIHERGFTHGDVKPENILVSGGEAVLSDFGFLRRDFNRRRRRAYTPIYEAPWYIKSSVVSPTTDTWAMGLSLCRLVCNGVARMVFDSHPKQNRMTVELARILAERYISFLQKMDPLLSDLVAKMTIGKWTMRQCLDHEWWQQ